VSGSLRTTYACTPCGAISDVNVVDLWSGPKDATPEMTAGILQLRAERELKFATCPRCGARNPVGVAEQIKTNKQWRWGFMLFFAALGAGIWFVPALAWFLVALDAIIVIVLFYALKRVGGSSGAKRSAVISVVTLAGIVGVAIFYPRWVSVLALILVVQFARKKEDPEEAWLLAAKKLQFAEPYR
jgi:hypothetical protein